MPIRETYSNLVPKAKVQYVDMEFIESCSGMVIPKNNKYIVMINYEIQNIKRVTFTILHELSHIHCHIHNQYNQRLLVSLNSEDYPTELKLLEDEANYVASILLFPNEVLIDLISRGYTYREILLERKVSSTALFNRLRNMLLYSMKLSKNTVYMLLKKYRESNDTTLNAVMSKIRDYFERNNYL